jgi:hypothetical protein
MSDELSLSLVPVGFLFGLLFEPEDGGDAFFRNIELQCRSIVIVMRGPDIKSSGNVSSRDSKKKKN